MPPHQINSYQWDFDVKEGEAFVPEAFGRVVIHEYDNFGIYHPVLRVVDDQVPGKVALRHGEVIVQTGNHAPEVDPGGPYTVVVGGELRLDASATREPDAACGDAITGYAWDLDGDGEYDDAQGATPRVAWNVLTTLLRPDQYPADPRTGLPQVVIRVRVTDSFGAAAVGSTVLTVYPREPVAVAYWQPQPVVPVDPITRKGVVTLDGRWSYPGNPGAGKPGCRLPGDCLFSYSWAVEGVTVANGAQVQVERSFPDLGQLPRTLRFKLTVIDLADARDEVEFQVTFGQLASAPPRVSFVEGNELHLAPGDRLYVRGVVTDPDFVPGNPNSGWIAKVMWDLDGVAESPEDIERPLRDTNGDGNIDGLDQPDTLLDLAWADLAQFGLQAPGEHTIMLQALDKTNVLGQAPLKLVVHPAAMVAVALAVPSSGGCTTTFELDGSSSRHLFPGTSIAQHRWDFESDGTTDATGALVTHTFRRFGVFQTKLEVLDLKGHSASTTVQLSTREGNVPPVGLHGGPYFVDTTLPDASLVLDATGSFDPDAACSDRIVEYRWDLDADGVHEHRFAGPQNTLTLAQLAYLPQSQLLPITLEVADTQGGQAQVQTTLI
ncbi:MAG: hypothetical protein FJ125_15305, partial [Deltaproteobacteria bacterium]|nr:hypothetical protein [Deltaproteobacteria bacterium]